MRRLRLASQSASSDLSPGHSGARARSRSSLSGRLTHAEAAASVQNPPHDFRSHCRLFRLSIPPFLFTWDLDALEGHGGPRAHGEGGGQAALVTTGLGSLLAWVTPDSRSHRAEVAPSPSHPRTAQHCETFFLDSLCAGRRLSREGNTTPQLDSEFELKNCFHLDHHRWINALIIIRCQQ